MHLYLSLEQGNLYLSLLSLRVYTLPFPFLTGHRCKTKISILKKILGKLQTEPTVPLLLILMLFFC